MPEVAWPKEEAGKILSQHKDLNKEILFETGFGPSGLPHIGTFAEVVRTLFVMAAVQELAPQAKTRLIVFCDDLDGLRSLPENLPNHDLLKPHLGAPLSSIPDPFQEKESFSGYMNGKLREFLDSFGFVYEYRSSTDCYRQGQFDQGLKQVMNHYEAVRQAFISTIAEDKRAAWSPFFVICEKCGKIYTTRVTETHPGSYEVAYACDQDGEKYKSCGHQGKTSILGGRAKVGWKVDWALRWYVFGVDYEMYGKDLMESATLSAKICRILGGQPPIPYKYELFLDETGAKISKKIGNGISMEQWLRFAPLGALLHFLLGNPNKAKKMGLPLLPRLIDEYLQAERADAAATPFTAPWFLAQVRHQPLHPTPLAASPIGFGLLYNLAEAMNIHESILLYDYAVRYDPVIQAHEALFRDLANRVTALAGEAAGKEEPIAFAPDPAFVPLFKQLVTALENMTSPLDGEALQTAIFSLAKDANLNPRDFFGFLYSLLLHKDQGPKLGPFFAMLGKEEALNLCRHGLTRL